MHAAGLDGMGGSSYIDSVLLRDRDINTAWRSASDGTLETRHLFCQNWRADVSAVLGSNGALVEWIKYRAYGAPFGMPVGDTDSDGDKDATDEATVFGWSSGYDVRADWDFDGDVDSNDYFGTTLMSNSSQGYAAMSSPDVENRKGYAGYENSYEILRFNHVRHRVMDTELGRWTRRDPLGYVDGMSLIGYTNSNPTQVVDPMGLWSFLPWIRPLIKPQSPPRPLNPSIPDQQLFPQYDHFPEYRYLWCVDRSVSRNNTNISSQPCPGRPCNLSQYGHYERCRTVENIRTYQSGTHPPMDMMPDVGPVLRVIRWFLPSETVTIETYGDIVDTTYQCQCAGHRFQPCRYVTISSHTEHNTRLFTETYTYQLCRIKYDPHIVGTPPDSPAGTIIGGGGG